jgi:hypothetical protein
VPTRTPSGKSMWKRPVYRSMHRMLTSPVYGGAYAYGKTEHLTSSRFIGRAACIPNYACLAVVAVSAVHRHRES